MKSVKFVLCVCLLAIATLGGGKGCPPPPVPGVDLRVTQIGVWIPESPMWGVEVPVEVVLQNHGTENFEGSVFGSLFVQSERSEDFQCGGLEPWGISIDFIKIPAGEERSFPTAFTLCKPGTYTLTVDIQFIPDDLIDENNSMATSVTFEWEEFTDLAYIDFNCYLGYYEFSVHCIAIIKNEGNTPLGGMEVGLVFTMIPPEGETEILDLTDPLWLHPGWLLGIEAFFETAERGWHTFVFQIDPQNFIAEDDETNNSVSVFMEL